MGSVDNNYQNLCDKLEILGYTQALPSSAAPLVGILLEDLIKTTESLRNTKLELLKYMEEKSCWELGVEPYKCDNSRLLSECNALHLELIKQKDEFEAKICDYRLEIRNLEADKRHFEEHCAQLEKNVRELLVKVSGNSKTNKNDVNMSKKPFVSTVKTGGYVANTSEPANAYRCAKCSSIVWTKHIDGKVQEVQLMQNGLQSQADQIAWLKEKLERRDREICRLNDLLAGGRPIDVLSQDCCYKNVGTLSEDVEELQKEKVELLKKYRDAQNAMHEAMQRAIALEEKNKKIERELEDFQKEALTMESEANAEIVKKENEIIFLKRELEKFREYPERDYSKSSDEKRKLHEKLNSLTQKEKELTSELERMKKKNTKLKSKLDTIQKNVPNDDMTSQLTAAEEEVKRYRHERDFFHKEYLKMVENYASNKEIELLRCQLECKETEIKALSKELLQSKYQKGQLQDDSRSSSSHSVQAAIMRAERERDVVKEELRMLRNERDCLREKLDCGAESQIAEQCRMQEENRLLQSRICKLESERRELMAAHIPEKTQLALVKEELEEMKRRVKELQCENHKMSTTNNQLRILQDQTEKALIDHQTKLLAAETNLENAESRLCAINTSRESAGKELPPLQREISILRSNNMSLEAEKDKILAELDTKTETIYQLEHDLKAMTKQKHDMQSKVKMLEKKLGETSNQKHEYESELHETSTESKSLREQILHLRLSRDQTLAENGRLTNDLAETAAELRQLKQKLKDSEKEVEKLKQQLQQYVQEVKRAEELLLLKEQEREEMLEHYRSLSHDAVLLEGNNQSLEIEAAEQRQQLCDAQTEVDNLKTELAAKEECILKLENQVSLLSSQIAECQAESEQNYDEFRITKVELEASKEIISKLNVQCEKLNAELNESKIFRCQLENEVKSLRDNMMIVSPRDRIHFSTLEDQLSSTKKELDVQRKKTYQLTQEIASLKKQMSELEEKLNCERKKSHQNEILAKEYSIKTKELQQALTESRFEQSKSQATTPRIISNPKHCQSEKKQYSDKIVSRASADEDNLRQNIKSDFKNHTHAIATSFKAITRNFSPNDKRALEQDIKEFLNSEKTFKDSVREYDEKISLDEDSSNIIVRRKRTIKTKTISPARKQTPNEVNANSTKPGLARLYGVVSNSLPSSPIKCKTTKESRTIPSAKKRSNHKNLSRTSIKSRSLSPGSFPSIQTEFARQPNELGVSTKRINSLPPETDFSKSLQMKRKHHFKGNLDFTTPVKLKTSPRRKAVKQNFESNAKKSSSDMNIYFMKNIRKTAEKNEVKRISNPNKTVDNVSSIDYSSSPAHGKYSGLESKDDSTYPKSSTTDTFMACFYPPVRNSPNKGEKCKEARKAKDESSSVIHIPPKVPLIVIPETMSSESKYNSTVESQGEGQTSATKEALTREIPATHKKESFKSIHSESNIISQEIDDTSNHEFQTIAKSQSAQESLPSRITDEAAIARTPIPEPSNGCSCMQNRKKHILATYNVSPDPCETQYVSENMYYRKYRLCRSPTGSYDAESSSGFETRKRLSRSKTKNVDLSGLPPPPPPPFHRRSK